MSEHLMAGSFLGPYQLLSPLGAGGMGQVWKALDPRLGRRVAVKVLSQDDANDPERKRMLRQEAKAASALNHPNIVTIFEIEADGTRDFIVMELVSGCTLQDRIRSSPTGLPLEQCLDYMRQLTAALAQAHRHGIIHRDLKPGNIMIRAEDNQVKIVDFGLAKRTPILQPGASTDITATLSVVAATPGVIAGTAAYMSPEQATGQPLDARSDIFSLGVVFSEMLTGDRPFHGETVMQLLQSICLRRHPRPTLRRPDLPPWVDDVLDRALQKDAADRFASMDEFSASLQGALTSSESTQIFHSHPSAATNPSIEVAASARRRSRTRFAMVALAAMILLLAAAGLLYRATVPTSSQSIAPAADPFQAYQQGRAALLRSDRPQNIERAVALFQSAIAADASYAPAYAALAEVFADRYRTSRDPQVLEQARSYAAKAIELNTYLAASHIGQAAVEAVSSKEPERAEQSLRHALQLDPNNALAHSRLGVSFYRAGKHDLAEPELRKAAELDPQNWKFQSDVGMILLVRGHYQEALERYQQTLVLVPDNAVAHRNLSAAYYMLEKWDQAAASLQRSLEIQPSATGFSNLGSLQYFQGKYAEAVAAFERAAELRPNDYQYWGNLADAYRWAPPNREKAPPTYAKAIQLARAALEQHPGDAAARASLALYLAKTGQSDQARAELVRIPSTQQTSPSMLYKVAVVQELCGDRPKALKTLQSARTAGYSWNEIQNDPELSVLRADPRFRTLKR
jgi:serine/threonine protein kinase/Tfp pilus assembly protein PilF